MRLLNRIHLSISLPLFLSLAFSFQAAELGPTQVTTNMMSLRESMTLALEHNLGIQIARFNPRIAGYELSSSYGIYDPTFELSAIHDRNKRTNPQVIGGNISVSNDERANSFGWQLLNGLLPSGTRYSFGGSYNKTDSLLATNNSSLYTSDLSTFTLAQPLLRDFWTDSGRSTIKINKFDVRSTELDLQLQVMTVVRDVFIAYYGVIAAHEEVRVREKALELATKLYEENAKKVKAGSLPPLDEKQAESEMAVASAELIAARRNVLLSENALKGLITDDYQKWYPIRIEPTDKLLALSESYDVSESWINALTKRPDFIAQKVELEKQGVLVKLSFNQVFPALDVVGSYAAGGSTFDGFHDSLDSLSRQDQNRWSIGAVLSIPLGNRAARNNRKAAKETFKQMELGLISTQQSIVIEVENAITLARSNYEQIPARRQATLFAEAALDAEQKKLDNGRSTSFFVLQFQRDLTEARSEEIRALTAYNNALAQLYYSEGTILERNQVIVQGR